MFEPSTGKNSTLPSSGNRTQETGSYRALVVKRTNSVGLEEVPQAPLPVGAYRVEVHASRVAPSTLDFLAGHRQPLALPFVPGSGAVGRVLEVGQGTQSFQTGDWVYINPWIQARCSGQDTAVVHKGRGPLTPLSHALSQIYLNGTFAKQTIAPGESLVSLPQLGQQSPSHWTALEPLHLAWALLIDAGFSPGQHVAIVDPSGPTAAAAALLASALGAGHLSLVTRSGSESAAQDETLREALKAGGSHAWICGEPDTRLLDSADLVVDAQDRWIHHDVRLSQLGFDLVKRGGTVVWSGASKAVVDMPFQKLVRKSVRLLASEQPSDHTLGKLVAWLDSRRDILSRYQVKSHSLSMHGDAFVHARGRLGLHLTTLLP